MNILDHGVPISNLRELSNQLVSCQVSSNISKIKIFACQVFSASIECLCNALLWLVREWRVQTKSFMFQQSPWQVSIFGLREVSRQFVLQFIFISCPDIINYLVKNDAASDNDCNDSLMTTSILTIITCSSSSMVSVWWSIITLWAYMIIWRYSGFDSNENLIFWNYCDFKYDSKLPQMPIYICDFQKLFYYSIKHDHGWICMCMVSKVISCLN